MACPQVATGDAFLASTLAHLDCQAQTIGSFGFQALAEPGSLAGIVLSALLALFIAAYAIRLLFGPGDEPRDIVGAVLKIGIALTIAVSWPAWRTVAYDTVLHGPAEVAAAIMPDTLPDPADAFARRLQGLDSGFAALTVAGTGRDIGRESYTSTTDGFAAVAMEDQTGFAWARTLFLATTIGSLAALRIAGGVLLALAPLFAGLLLFDLTRGLFAGWLRGLALVALGSLAMTVLLSVQIAVTEPWLADALARRASGGVVPTAPTEMLALALAFAIATAALLFMLGKVAFQQALSAGKPVLARVLAERRESVAMRPASAGPAQLPVQSRAMAISESVEASVRRESSRETIDRMRTIGGLPSGTPREPAGRSGGAAEPLGSTYRRSAARSARSQRTRDDRR